MADIPFFRLHADGSETPAAIDRPADVWAKAIKIMQEGLRFEIGLTDYGVEVMIVDRHGSVPRQVAVESCANLPAAVRKAVDELIEKFTARLMPGGHLRLVQA
jgi:hypothetical protein